MQNFLKQYISKSKNQVSRVIDGEAVIILRKKGRHKEEERKVIILTPEATRVWGLLERKLRIDNLVKQISKEFNIDYRENRNEIKEFITSLIKAGLVDVSLVVKNTFKSQ
ncbi:MAG: PqqD family protein [Candidatus Omnitrophota bacterium]